MNKNNTVGVVVCRLQVPQIHDGHRYLLDTAKQNADKLLVALGVNGGWAGSNDPLDFETRKVMLQKHYPDAHILPIYDCSTNEAWSENLDTLIENNFSDHDITLFGSRDSFIPHYLGKHKTQYVEPKHESVSGTEVRKKLANKIIDSEDFRTGVIYASNSQNFPTSFQAVDIAIRHTTERKVIVGRKPGEKNWRFPGGFVDPKDLCLEDAARREAREEVGNIEVADVKYIASVRANDYRYRKSEHKLMTALFSAVYLDGEVKAGDDLVEARWQDFDGLVDCLMDGHKVLGELFLKSINE
ncbi:MAG: NUDIX domain-containing protein [Patescibacteria group bacterium]